MARATFRWAGLLTIIALVVVGFLGAEAAPTGASLEAAAPSRVGVDQPIALKLVIHDASDIAGYEARLLFDAGAVEFDALQQRQNDIKAIGRDVAALGPVTLPDGVAFGQYSCPAADCLNRQASRRAGGGRGQLQLATIVVTPHKPGTVELRLTQAKFVDASGQPIDVQNADTTIRVQVGTGGPVSAAPVAARSAAATASAIAAGPFDLTKDGNVDYADAALVGAAWSQLRQHGFQCGSSNEPQ